MLYKNLLAFAVISISSYSFAIPVILPGEDVLLQKFENVGMSHFAEKTNIIKTLAGQEKEPLGIVLDIDYALSDYCQTLPQFIAIAAMKNRSFLIKEILKDFPEALID